MDPLDNALDQVNQAGAQDSGARTEQVDKAFGGGQAPAIMKSVAHHLSTAVTLYGKKHISQVIGCGNIPEEGSTPASVHASVNFGDFTRNKHISREVKGLLLDIKKELHNCFLQQQILAAKTRMPVAIVDTPYFKHVVEPKLKAFDLSGFAAWVPTLNTAFYFEEFELEPGIEKYFTHYPMASRTVTVPGATVRMKAKLQADSDSFTAQYNTSGSYTMTAQDAVAHTDITEDLMNDLVPQAGGFDRLRREVAMAVQRSKEDAIINGDDTISSSVQGDGHMDSDVAGGAATLFNKAFKGLRKRAIAASATYGNGGQGVSLQTYNGLLTAMGKFAIDKGDLLIVVGPSIANKAVFGNVPEMLTMHNVGNLATLVTGKLPPIFGIEQYASEWVREDVTTTGVYASTSVLTTILAVRKSRFVVGQRAPLKIWATPSLASSDKMLLSAKERFTFGGVPQSASEISVAAAINVALT